MLAFACGVSFMFNYLKNANLNTGSSTGGIFTYFFWVLLQPFRGNPDYDTVADLPYDSSCLTGQIQQRGEINTKAISECREETMYNTTCMLAQMLNNSKAAAIHLLTVATMYTLYWHTGRRSTP